MKVSEFREMNNEELNEKIYLLKEQLFNLRRKKAVGQLEHGEEVRRVRKDIARAKLVQRERELGVKVWISRPEPKKSAEETVKEGR